MKYIVTIETAEGAVNIVVNDLMEIATFEQDYKWLFGYKELEIVEVKELNDDK